jgi:hypothetical protein
MIFVDKIMIDLKKNNRLLKIITIISFILIILALSIVLVTPSAKGYEISIYNAFPWYFWFLILLSNTIIISGVFINLKNEKICYKYLYFVVLFNQLILFLLPLIRNYYFFGGGSDSLIHFGEMSYILKEGFISTDNFYPILTIFSSTFSLMTDINDFSIPIYINIIFYLCYIIFFLILAKKISKSRLQLILLFSFSLLVSPTLVKGHNFAPFSRSIYLFPMLLYISNQLINQKFNYKFYILIVVLSITIVFFHPITSIFIIILYLSYFLNYKYIISIITKKKYAFPPEKPWISLTIISILTLITWFSTFSSFKRFISSTVGSSLSGGAPVETYLYLFEKAKLIDAIQVFLLKFGDLFIFLVLALIFSIIFKIYKKNKDNIILIFQFGIFSFLTFIFLVFNLSVGIRPIVIATIFSIIITAIGISNLNIDYKKIRVYIILFLTFILIISTFSFYPSPLIKLNNPIYTSRQVNSCEFFSETYSSNLNVYYNDRLYAISSLQIPGKTVSSSFIPEHFNFSKNNESIDSTFYLIISKQLKISYPLIYPNYKEDWKYTPSDFNMLKNNFNFVKVYMNDEVEIYLYNH